MGEFVGVNPVNLAELAKRLQRLHEVLIRNGPIIQQNMQQWGSDVSFAPLPRLIDSALNDTRDMDARTTKAYGLANESGWDPATLSELLFSGRRPSPADKPGFIGPRSPYVQLDWATTGESGYQAEQDVQAMKDALAGKDPEAVRVSLSGVREHLTQHLHDKPYLAAFWAQAGPLALQAARALYNRTGATLFSVESTSILRALGSSLAAAGQMRVGTGKDSRPLLSPQARAAITKSSDPWSVGMLFKYGPDGKSWDSRFLAEVTRSMLDARAAGKAGWPPPGKDPETDIDASRRQRLLAEFDAMGAVLDRAAENGRAARHVLGDPATGLTYARMLVNDSWHTPGYDHSLYLSKYLDSKSRESDPDYLTPPGKIDTSSHVARFLEAAASATRGASDDAKESAWSVVHIVQANSEFAKAHPQATLPKEIRNSFIYIADRYLPDFATSLNGAGYEARLRGRDPNGPWVAYVDGNDLAAYFKQALHDPKDLGIFQGKMNARISASVAASIRDPLSNYLADMSSLNGLLARIEKDFAYDNAQKADQKAQRFQTFLSIISGGYGALSFSNPLAKGTISQVFVAVAQPMFAETIDTDHTVRTLKLNEDEFRDRLLHVKIPVIQGLVSAGAVNLPPNTSWYKDGAIIPNAEFTDWFSTHERVKYGDRRLEEWVRDAEHAMEIQR
ncbi:hypothetical protein [Sphaerimonospora thailandensis]|uniref:Uncharacterized protein n=1 Tax=Sphaerimonospora thailandensis TaxID=795644 RepID=A0A8J3R7V3_9ACTN|nr:hypothetical protein [Sphaerimonospora thailandensis]GIH69039.1 hypothetical protein Mth01_12920 [Sphaerimonospora thailandensis]